MAHLFYTVMQKRVDGKIYPDVHKTDERIYLIREDAELALANMSLGAYFHVVPLVAMSEEDFRGSYE